MKNHIARILIGAPLLVSIALLSPASAEVPATAASDAGLCHPSKLDYVVLASFADATNILAMSTYRAPRQDSSPTANTPNVLR